jgi:hypothetical protein
MRRFLIALLLVGACPRVANLQVTPRIADGSLVFRFREGKWVDGAPGVNGIDIWEVTDGKRGKTVCKVDRRTRVGSVEVGEWRYGEPIDGFDIEGCGALEKGRLYAVTMGGPYGAGIARFILEEDGSVRMVEYEGH